MGLFHFQYRVPRLVCGTLPSAFPVEALLEIRLAPEDAFGVACNHRTVAPRARAAKVFWNANEGITSLEAELMDCVAGKIDLGQIRTLIDGNVLKISASVDTIDVAMDFATSVNQVLPLLLSANFNAFVWIKEFMIRVGDASFRFELGEIFKSISTATPESTVENIRISLENWSLLRDQHRKLIGSLSYYRHALQLAKTEPENISTVPEIILNLTKALEIIFTDKRDIVRERAGAADIPVKDIEEIIIPLFLLRSKLDVAHVAIAPLTVEERQIVVNFSFKAIANVGNLLRHITKKALLGEIAFSDTSKMLDKERRELINALEQYGGGKLRSFAWREPTSDET